MRNRRLSPQERPDATLTEVRRSALNLLARREHSTLELRHKLSQRGFAADLIAAVLEELVAENLLSDARYAEIYAHSRTDKGYGPRRIQQELRERGVAEEIIAVILAELDDFWMVKLSELHRKRFSGTRPRDIADQAKQTRFLLQRGFTPEQIQGLFRGL